MSVYVQWPWPGAGLDCDKILNRKSPVPMRLNRPCMRMRLKGCRRFFVQRTQVAGLMFALRTYVAKPNTIWFGLPPSRSS